MWFPKILTEDDMNQIKEKVHALEQRQDACDVQHLSHNRRHDYAAKNQLLQTELLKRIAERIDSFEPTIKRSANNYTTFDTILRWAGGGTVILGLISALAAAIYSIKEIL